MLNAEKDVASRERVVIISDSNRPASRSNNGRAMATALAVTTSLLVLATLGFVVWKWSRTSSDSAASQAKRI